MPSLDITLALDTRIPNPKHHGSGKVDPKDVEFAVLPWRFVFVWGSIIGLSI